MNIQQETPFQKALTAIASLSIDAQELKGISQENNV